VCFILAFAMLVAMLPTSLFAEDFLANENSSEYYLQEDYGQNAIFDTETLEYTMEEVTWEDIVGSLEEPTEVILPEVDLQIEQDLLLEDTAEEVAWEDMIGLFEEPVGIILPEFDPLEEQGLLEAPNDLSVFDTFVDPPALIAPFNQPVAPLPATIELEPALIAPFADLSADYLLQEPATYSEIAPFNTNPNIAITITDNLFGLNLQDLANHEERWYNFSIQPNRKVVITMMHNGGLYGLQLFRLNGNSLNLVEFSLTATGTERINYISSSGGVYFLAVVPLIPATPHLFSFRVDVISNFDSFELNETAAQAQNFTNSIALSANIDNQFDQDWYRLTVTTPGRRDIAVIGAPIGHYAIFVFDNNMNQLVGTFANGIIGGMHFTAGTYYIRINSHTGQHVMSNYELIVTPANHGLIIFNGELRLIRPSERVWTVGNTTYIVGFTNGNLTINGEIINVSGTYYERHFINGRLARTLLSGELRISVRHGFNLVQFTDGTIAIPIDVTSGFLQVWDSRISLESWWFDTHPSAIFAHRTTPVTHIVTYVAISTGRVHSTDPQVGMNLFEGVVTND